MNNFKCTRLAWVFQTINERQKHVDPGVLRVCGGGLLDVVVAQTSVASLTSTPIAFGTTRLYAGREWV